VIQKNNEKYMLNLLKTKTQIATAIAILFHAIGFVGMFINKDFFVATTSLNLLLMGGLLFYTQQKPNIPFAIFFIVCFITGITVEIVGTSTGFLFGKYEYGKMLGIAIKNVPVVIGINWFIIMYCCGITVHTILEKLATKVEHLTGETPSTLKLISIISDGAMVAVFFDWIMEPAAVKLGYWAWLGDGEIPSFNYLTWFAISTGLMAVFGLLKFNKQNIFAVHLLMIMIMFFLLVRTFL
jgi:bisanhydrobacterioruberin hydratase